MHYCAASLTHSRNRRTHTQPTCTVCARSMALFVFFCVCRCGAVRKAGCVQMQWKHSLGLGRVRTSRPSSRPTAPPFRPPAGHFRRVRAPDPTTTTTPKNVRNSPYCCGRARRALFLFTFFPSDLPTRKHMISDWPDRVHCTLDSGIQVQIEACVERSPPLPEWLHSDLRLPAGNGIWSAVCRIRPGKSGVGGGVGEESGIAPNESEISLIVVLLLLLRPSFII